jgi:hypothetical protein
MFSGKGPSTLLATLVATLSTPELVAQDVKSLETRLNDMQVRYETRIAALEYELARVKATTEDPKALERTLAVETAATTFDPSGLPEGVPHVEYLQSGDRRGFGSRADHFRPATTRSSRTIGSRFDRSRSDSRAASTRT